GHSRHYATILDRMTAVYLKQLQTSPPIPGQPSLDVFKRGFAASKQAANAGADMYFNEATTQFFQKVCIQWRNEEMAEKVLEFYASDAGPKGKPLEARVG